MNNLVSSLSGAGGGVVSMALTYPLITIGTRLQTQTSHSRRSYNGMLDAARKIYLSEGLMGLYSGLGSALFGIAITNGLYYYWYELLKRLMEKRQKSASDRLSITQSLFVGAVAGAITVLMTNPIWVVNTRLAAGRKTIDDQSPDSSPSVSAHSSTPSLNGSTNEAKITALECRKLGSLETLIAILKEDGPSSLWQGVWPALVLVANPSIQYMVFEQLKHRLIKFRHQAKLNSFDHFFMGASSKLVATFLTYPYIVVKARMQLKQPVIPDSPKQQSSVRKSSYATTIASLKTILRNEGVGGFYKGLSSKLLQSVLTAAILFAAKDALEGVTRDLLLLLLSYWRRLARTHKHIN